MIGGFLTSQMQGQSTFIDKERITNELINKEVNKESEKIIPKLSRIQKVKKAALKVTDMALIGFCGVLVFGGCGAISLGVPVLIGATGLTLGQYLAGK